MHTVNRYNKGIFVLTYSNELFISDALSDWQWGPNRRVEQLFHSPRTETHYAPRAVNCNLHHAQYGQWPFMYMLFIIITNLYFVQNILSINFYCCDRTTSAFHCHRLQGSNLSGNILTTSPLTTRYWAIEAGCLSYLSDTKSLLSLIQVHL